MRNLAIAVVVLAGAAWAGSAGAVSMTYTITGYGSGSLNGVTFDTTAYTITMLGDTSNLSGTVLQLLDPLDSTTVDIDGVGKVTLDVPTLLGATDRIGFLEPGDGALDLTDFTLGTDADGTSGVDLSAPFGPITAAPFGQQFKNIASSGGLLTLTHDDGLIEFSGALTVTGAGGGGGVPEPASWALLLVGFGGLGAVLRHRRAPTALASA